MGYTEYLVEFDNEALVVYVSGLTPDGFWEETNVIDDANNPEEFAEGYAARMREEGWTVQVMKVNIEATD